MKQIQVLLNEYSDSHQNKTNKAVHWVCVPAILFSILGLIAQLHFLMMAAAIVLTLFYYARLDWALMLAMAAVMLSMAALIMLLPNSVGLYIAIFVLAWIGQFYGHKVEGKKPSFFKDMQFLLIGPVWCMDALLSKVLPRWQSRQLG